MLSISVLTSPFVVTGTARAAGVPHCDVPGQITPHPTNWYSVKVPAFANGSMSDYAVEPLAPSRIWVTNGAVVMRTTDSGCHWAKVYELPSSGTMNAGNSRILEIEVGNPGTVYLPIQQSEPVVQPRVVVTRDAGDSWSQADGGLLSSIPGRLRDFDASLGNGSAAAILVDVEMSEPGVVGFEGNQMLLTTGDGGGVWEPYVSPESDVSVTVAGSSVNIGGFDEMESLAVNPLRASEVWLYGANGVRKYDGTTMLDSGLQGGARLLDISLDGRAVLAYEDGSAVGQLSLDGGLRWIPVNSGVPVDSMDIVSAVPLEIATGSYGKVLAQYLFPGQQAPLLFDISPLDQRFVSDIQVAFPENGADPSVYGRTASTIEVTFEPPEVPFKANVVRAPTVHVPVGGNNRLSPPYRSLKMRPGQSKTIPYTLNLPAASTPLDVYFMIDISGSMQGTINGIRSAMQAIAERLGEGGIDVQFGVGSFRSYDTPPPYKRNLDIQPAGAELAAALNSLSASGGGDETQMAALLQSVTGEGDSMIPPDQNMHFRPGSLRVAIEVTDEPISQGGQHPSYDTVVKALLEHDVKQVGLAIQEPPVLGEQNYDNPGGPAAGLIQVAKGSKAVAPAGGVDCDGDGTPELDEGDALVCLIDPAKAEEASLMADAIVHVLEAVQDIQDLTVEATPPIDPSAESEVVESIAPSVLPQLDLKEANSGTFDVTVRCPHVPRPTLFPVQVSVSRPGSLVASADLDVRCVPVVKKEPEAFPLAVFVPVAAVPPPPPRPPDPVPEPNPNPNPNPQQNPQAQAGFAAQKQQQPQVALAGQEGAAAPDTAENAADEFFMTDHSDSRVPPLAFIFTTGAVTAIGGYVLLTRQRTQTAQARNRRNRRR